MWCRTPATGGGGDDGVSRDGAFYPEAGPPLQRRVLHEVCWSYVKLREAVFGRIILLLCLTAGLWAGETAADLLHKAEKAEGKGDFANAYLLAAQATALDPGNQQAWAFAKAMERRAQAGLRVTTANDPANRLSAPPLINELSRYELEEAREALPPPVLEGQTGLHDFDVEGDSKAIFEQVLKAYKIGVIFDSDYQPVKRQRVRLQQVDWRQAIRTIENLTNSFIVPVSSHLAMVARDTPQKRAEIEPTMSIVVPLNESTQPSDIQDAARAVQAAFDLKKLAVSQVDHAIVFRDRVSVVKPAVEVFKNLMNHLAQVMIDVELVSTSANSTLNLGLTLPTQFPLVALGTFLNNTPTIPSGFTGLATFGGGKTLFGIGVGSAALFANFTDSQTTLLARTTVRSVDGQAASAHFGERYPLITQGYYGNTSGSGTVYTPPPTIQFEDLGVVLKVTPHVHGRDEVTLEIESEFKALTGGSLNNIPVIGNRKIVTRVRMRFDETAVLAGLVNESDSRSWSGLALLSALPPLRNNSTSSQAGQFLLTIRPYLLNEPPAENASPSMWVGTETRPLTPLE